ncbi:hypothetical protein CDAR_183631 [Caerostris darwini]|uniref:Uncharacterized protein n=1 Tax=Caerostris darwini TaxID=1538125 RepID=A0AAV4TU61_9ARAC|nr:hypothetical protein CDAR_183631 [Caerostris darwini]
MLGGLCNGTLVPSALKAVREKTHHQTVKIVFPEQSTDAVIYVTVSSWRLLLPQLSSGQIRRCISPISTPNTIPVERSAPVCNEIPVLLRMRRRTRKEHFIRSCLLSGLRCEPILRNVQGTKIGGLRIDF